MAILVLERDLPFAGGVLGRQRFETAANGREIAGRKEPGSVEHLGVRDRRRHIVSNQSIIEKVIVAGGETQHALVQGLTLVP